MGKRRVYTLVPIPVHNNWETSGGRGWSDSQKSKHSSFPASRTRWAVRGWFYGDSADGWVVFHSGRWEGWQWSERVAGCSRKPPSSIYKLHHFRSAVRERSFSQRAYFLLDDRSHARFSWKRCILFKFGQIIDVLLSMNFAFTTLEFYWFIVCLIDVG